MVLGSITVNASPISESEYPYQAWIPEKNLLVVSTGEFKSVSGSQSTAVTYTYSDGSIVSGYFGYSNSYMIYTSTQYTFHLTYVEDVGWSATSAPMFSTGSGTSSSPRTSGYVVSLIRYDLNSNPKKYVPTMYTNFNANYSSGDIPSDLPEVEDLESIINGVTNTTNEAQTLQADLASSYNSYQTGNISGETLQSNIDTTVSTLNNLSNNSGNTLADLMAVNNGLTYAQTVQDKLNADELNQHLEITTAVKNAITGYINQSNTAYTEYTNGNKTQSETITTLQNQIIYLNQIITNGTAKNSADIEAVNSAINTVQGIINNVSNYSDIDKELSSEYESGEQAEKEFLEDEIAETTSQIQDMSAEKQFSSQQKTESLNILGSIWDLEIFKRLIPICAVFMVVCVAIGVKYRL